MKTLETVVAHSKVFIIFLFIMITTFVTSILWGTLVRPFLTVYLLIIYLFKTDINLSVKVSRKIYDVEYTLGLWVFKQSE